MGHADRWPHGRRRHLPHAGLSHHRHNWECRPTAPSISICLVVEGPIQRTREGVVNELIKILLEGDGGSNKTNTASNTRLRLTTEVGQAHAATGVLLDLGTNSQPHRPENASVHNTRASLTYTGLAGEHHQSNRSLLVKPVDFHRTALHRSGR
jgi:hypothetical protein